MRIGLDVMGGDFAPEATILGALEAVNELPENIKLVLIGNREKIIPLLDRENADHNQFEIVNAAEVIEMGDHPAKSFTKKPNSSIAIGFDLLRNGEIDGFASAGNTGAMLIGVHYTIRTIPGVIRPAITSPIPTIDGKPTILLDVGVNPDCRPDVLYQYGILGSYYAKYVWDIKNPRIGLLNIGSEETKGNLVVKSTYELMKDTKEFNFIGNIEGNDFFKSDKTDVIVCDGFVGNVVLKGAEAFYSMIIKRGIKDKFFEKFNFINYGGTPILGINADVIIGHGISNSAAIKSMILHTKEVIKAKLTKKFKKVFK
ncbi:MAG: phosphate acyltransferase PlsX [Bacteroidales bacterium]|nr:phosphate acyltransferase PlsX [Bacteroidales bacterium]